MRHLLRSVSVKSRLAFACAGLFVAMVAAITALQALQLRTSIRDVLTAQQSSLVRTIAEDIDDKFELRQRALIAASGSLAGVDPARRATLQDRLAGQPALASLFDLVLVISPQGEFLATLPRSQELHTASGADRDYLKETLRTGLPVISAPYVGRLIKTPNVMMTAPVLGPNGEIVAVLGGALSLQRPNFLGQLSTTPLGRTGYFTVFTKGGAAGNPPVLVVHPQKSRIMTSPAQGNPSIARALAGFEGSEEGTNGRGEHGFYSFRALRQPGWVLAAMLPIEEAYAPIVEAQRNAILHGAVAALAVAPLVWLLAWWLLSPLTALRDRIAALRANPDSKDDLPATGGDEIGDLARDFNDLIRERRQVEHALRETESRLLTFADNLPVLVSYVDRAERFRYTNATYKDWFGIETGALLGLSLREAFGEREYAKIADNVAQVLQGYPVTFEREAVYGGKPRFVQATYLPHYGRRGDVTGFYVLVSDISARKAREMELAHLAQHDPLTGLPNRSLFEDRLEQALGRRSRTGQPVALMYLDIDHFKTINDTYGHSTGDELLKAFAGLLTGCVRSTDTVARLGGDEFTIILESVEQAEDSCAVADKILAALRTPMRVGNAIIAVSTSIGISWADKAPVSGPEFVERADAALYRAKASGKNTYEFEGEPQQALRAIAG
jgi:diguanylate cyclase (GGDEF)-like protein/PAS domain S-box-containing protein